MKDYKKFFLECWSDWRAFKEVFEKNDFEQLALYDNNGDYICAIYKEPKMQYAIERDICDGFKLILDRWSIENTMFVNITTIHFRKLIMIY